jgi:acyl dehydratase
MTATDRLETVEVDHDPNLTRLLARAVVTSPGRSGEALPARRLVRRGVTIDRDDVAAYAEVCGFTLSDTLPPTYLHLLAFPLSVEIMAGRDFPFALAGLVHVRNRITQHRPVAPDEVVDVAVHLADLRPHPAGRQFDVVAEATVAGSEPGVAGTAVWSSRSTYLRRGRGGDEAAADDTGAAAVDVAALPTTARWSVPADVGRRYGAVSGDRNPIHLSSVTARAFGFPRAIAHGMWSKARSLAALEGRLPDAFAVDVVFKLPVLLPATLEYATRRDGDRWELALRSRPRRGGGKPHLAGVITPV